MSLPTRHTILIVDSNENSLASARDILKDEYEVITARSPGEAVQFLTTRNIHIVLTDQGIPELLQKDFYDKMPVFVPRAVPIIFSGEALLDEVLEAINQGYMFRYITKPWIRGELRDVVRQAAEHYNRIAEREKLLRDLEAANKKLQEQNEQLQELDRLKTAFMAVASHELRTPVTLIGGYATFMEKTADRMTPELMREMTDKIQDGARRLERIIKAMFQALESEGPRPSLEPAETDLGDLVEAAIRDARPFIERRSLNVVTNIGPLPKLWLDPTKMKDVLANLLLNAIKFTPDGGTIEICAQADEDKQHARIVVKDHGVGIPEKDLKHIFSPMFGTFDTLHHSSGVYEFQRRGIGLGLAVSKKFVELHGGKIEVQSEVNKGTIVTVSLPIATPA